MNHLPLVQLSNMCDRKVIVRIPRPYYRRHGVYSISIDNETCKGLVIEVLPWDGRKPHITSWEPQNRMPIRTKLTIGERVRLLLGPRRVSLLVRFRILSDRKP